MTRLFLRFYLGVVAILIAAWLIQSYVFRQRMETQNIRVVEQALSGGVRLARDKIAAATPDQFSDVLLEVQEQFAYPVQPFRLSSDWLEDAPRNRLFLGQVVLLEDHVAIALPDRARSDMGHRDAAKRQADTPERLGLIFGPLPQFVGPSQAEVTFGYGAVFLLAAIAIAVLLRPVATQFRAVERTAAAIAQGDLSARIDGTEAPKDLALVHAFNSMADRTETLLQSQRELLQAVSHELRTPLSRIRFATDLVETAKTDEERRSRLEAIDNATQKLDDLVGELLTYARLESDVPNAEPESIEVHSLLSELIEMHAPLNPSVQYQLEAQDDPIHIIADRNGLSRAIENLLSNAGRHAKQRVDVRVVEHDDGIVMEVDDDGEGIPESDWKRIFEPFVRLENSSHRGAGLGLALVSRIAQRHGGQVTVSESPSGGSRFLLRFPKS